MELPPRTRRIQTVAALPTRANGTTSAYAENTGEEDRRIEDQQNYLRVRGEYLAEKEIGDLDPELPPRTRRIRKDYRNETHIYGTTSAYAENTPRSPKTAPQCGNYLRVRGEYYRFLLGWCTTLELPPRTRRIHQGVRGRHRDAGTTSAYAENTTALSCCYQARRNYLRVRGEYYSSSSG